MKRDPITRGYRPIGAILLEDGKLTPQGADEILMLQRQEELRFGDAAIRLGLLTTQDVQLALSQQFDFGHLAMAANGERPVSEELIAAYQPFSQQVETLRRIRSELLLRWLNKPAGRNVLAVASAERFDGRSYLAANLAIVLSQVGLRTLLIDADLRAPRQQQLFKLESKVGLSNLLAGWSGDDAVVPIPCLEGLAVLPAGPTPPNPLEILNRPAFSNLLEQARETFDVVLIDTPPAVSGADAQLIAVRAGAVVGVARAHQSRFEAFSQLAKSMARSGVTVVGSVLNEAPPPRRS